nr:MAG TPA: hypothetical protein [Caudoviricetes sp.]DAR88872.1 MAG TPA: hypothetical protein [Caudoviricetes sp.]
MKSKKACPPYKGKQALIIYLLFYLLQLLPLSY